MKPPDLSAADISEARARVFGRAEVWWVRLVKQYGLGVKVESIDKVLNLGNELFGRHMCVVLQLNSQEAVGIVVAPITSAYDRNNQLRKKLSSWIELHKGDGGVLHKSYVACEQIRYVDKGRVLGYVGKVSPERMERIEDALRMLLFSNPHRSQADSGT